MIAVLSHRLEGSKLDDLTLGTGVTELLLNLPEFASLHSVVPHLRGVVESIDLAERLVDALLPGATFEVSPVLGGRFDSAIIDASDGRDLPFAGMAPTRPRALLAAAFRAYDFASSAQSSFLPAADNGNAPVILFRAVEAAE